MHVRRATATACVVIAALGSAAGCAPGVTGPSSLRSATPSADTAASPVASPPAPTPAGAATTPGAPITVLPPPAAEGPVAGTAVTGPAASTGASGTTGPAHSTSATVAPAPATPGTRGTPPTVPPPPAGTVVVIDPGHNGASAAHPEIINALVPAGFGRTKPCNTTGTATNAGYPEHEFTWQVALALRDLLQAKGITVVMTRDSDTGVGPCVDKRADIGNSAHAAAVVSIHGDGEAAGVHGFIIMTASRAPAGPDITSGTERLARDVRTGLIGAGFPVSNTLGSDGLWQRGDLAGLNLSLRPTVMVECGNMRNAAEAAVMTSAAGRQRYAGGLAAGVLAFVAG